MDDPERPASDEAGSPDSSTQAEYIASPDRAAAIEFHAFLELALRVALQKTFYGRGKPSIHLIGGLETPGELGFASQARLAYCIGVIGPETLRKLLIIAKIRNRFAHTPGSLSFDDQRIRHLCSELMPQSKRGELLTAEPAKLEFIISATRLGVYLMDDAERRNPWQGPGEHLL